MQDPFANFESTVLPNGLTVYALHLPDRPWQHMSFLIHSGADQDIAGIEGTAHFMEHLVSENGILPQKEIEQYLRKHGGEGNFGATSYPYTEYDFSLPAKDAILEEGLLMFGSMLLLGRLDKYVERERQVIIGEFRQYYPADYMYEHEVRKNRALHTGHALERMPIPLGTLDSIARITQSDLQNYYDTHYTPPNMSIVAVGGKSLAELVVLLNNSPFATTKPGFRTARKNAHSDVALSLESRFAYSQSEYVSTQIEVGEYNSFAKIPGTFTRECMTLFSRSLNEVLFEEVRIRNAWTYDIHSGSIPFGPFHEYGINAGGIMLEALDYIENVINECIVRTGEDAELFQRIREASIATETMRDSTGKGICEDAMMSVAWHDRVRTLQEQIQSFESAKLEDMQEISCLLAPEMRHTRLALS